jgi:DNA (cytosine-5)-methyltransferase 3A
MNVLSLFDGMSCGRIALDQLEIKVDNYYACEIDKYAMQVSQANYPEIIQLGDVCDVKSEDLPKIDLILAGSPCQGFSFAGKQLAFDDPRSALFFEFIRLLKECKPKYFLLENVRMKKEYLQVISEQVSACYPEIPFGIEPTMICSSLVSAQSRKRYYWTNIPNVTQPKQKGIVLRDILETRVNQDRLSDMTNQDNKAYCLTTTYPCARPQRSMDKSEKSMIPVEDTVPDSTTLIYDSKDKSHKPKLVGRDNTPGHDILKRIYSEDGKSPTITAHAGKGTVPKIETKPIQVGIATDINGHDILKRVYSEDGKSPTVNTCQGGNREPKVLAGAYRARSIDKDGNRVSWKEVKPKQMLELRRDEKSNTVTSVQKDNVLTQDEVYWRKLTPLECERLQTVPDNYTNHVSNSQRFKMLGNGWTIEVIKHIFKNMERQ